MSKDKEKFKILGIIVLAITAFLYFGSISSGGNLPSITGNKLVCDVTLKNPAFGSVEIEKMECSKGGTCAILAPNSLVPMSVISDTGKVKMSSDGAVFDDHMDYDLVELQSDTFRLSVCSSTNKGLVEVLNDKGAAIDSEYFSV